MKKHKFLQFAAAVVQFVLTVAAVYKSCMAEIATEKVPRGTLNALTGSWAEPQKQSDGSLIVEYAYTVAPGQSYDDAFLLMQSYWTNFTVQLSSQTVYTHANTSVDGYTHLISLGALYFGERISVVFEVHDVENLAQLYGSRFYVGNQSGIYDKVLAENLYAFIFMLIALIMSAATIFMSVLLRRANTSRYHNIISLGLFILVAGVWVLTDSDLLLLITARTSVITALSFLSFFIMPVFLLGFTRQMMKMDERVFNALSASFALLFGVYAFNYLFGLFNNNILLYFEHALLVVTMLIIMFYGVRGLRVRRTPKLVRVVLGYAVFCAGSAAALVMFYVRPFSGYSQLYALGTAGFILFLFDAACRDTYEQLERSVNLEFRARLAYTDAMTNVGNRAAFHEKQMRDKTYTGPITYLMVDINNLKTANDTYGHAVGDELIIRTAEALKAATNGLGRCYRIGGDEFIACMCGLTEAQAHECLTRFYERVAQANANAEMPLSAAAGCVWSADPDRDLDMLFRQADAEMYKEKLRIKGEEAR